MSNKSRCFIDFIIFCLSNLSPLNWHVRCLIRSQIDTLCYYYLVIFTDSRRDAELWPGINMPSAKIRVDFEFVSREYQQEDLCCEGIAAIDPDFDGDRLRLFDGATPA
jgi:hypothetical protein